MSGEEIGSLGKLESLRLMTSCNVMDKKIAYLGLCFLFEDDDEFFIMGTCGITSDLKHNNLYVVGMVLCALS